MKLSEENKRYRFYNIGLSYKKANAHLRGQFNLNAIAKENIQKEAKEKEIPSLLIISTCNRTELYGFAQHPYQLIELLCKHSNGDLESFKKVGFIRKSTQAIEHLFRVGTGLDSQIVGDFEIIGQIKESFRSAKKSQLCNPFTERLLNCVIQASKRVKNETKISSGATSVSFASVQYILNHVKDIDQKNILLFGTGKIGRNTCENLVKHTENKNITLINRTDSKAVDIAGKFNINVKPYSTLSEQINKADIIIVATGANQPTITKANISNNKALLILDVSIPENVSTDVNKLKHVNRIGLDKLSSITNQTLATRQKEIPKVENIIEEMKLEFNQWLETRKFAPTIKALKDKLIHLKDTELNQAIRKDENFNTKHAEQITNSLIQKITGHFASHLRTQQSADDSIAMIEKIFEL